MPTDGSWLPAATVYAHLGVDVGSAQQADADRARLAATAYVERVRSDLLDGVTYAPDPDVVHGALLLAARLYARRSSPQGLASFGEFGPGAIMRLDPDVERLLGVGRYGSPRVG